MDITIKVTTEEGDREIKAEKGENLRTVLLRHNVKVYGKLSQFANCGGSGICATCGVYIADKEVTPIHWHDQLARKFGYPRLTCQITLNEDLHIVLPSNKIMWGQLWPKMSR